MINDQSLYFVFNGRKSSDFGVWCSGDDLYRRPERDVEYLSVPGRNGDIVVDNGRWQNVQVTYPCFIPNHFRERYADLMSWLTSQRGYCRLEDSRHPEFYRLGRIDADTAPEMVAADDSGKFDIVFNCMPQRFYKSGEEALSIPVAPAQTPSTARRYWRLSAFTESQQTNYKSVLSLVGYSEAEINAMQFEIIKITDTEAAWLETLTGGHVFETVGYVDDRFWMMLSSFDPTTDSAGATITLLTPQVKLSADTFQGGLPIRYIILQKFLGTEIYYAGRKIAQDETYQFGTIVNPTRFAALPKIRITLPTNLSGLSGATVYMAGIGQSGVAIKWADALSVLAGSTVTIDTELMDVYILTEDNNTPEGTFVSLNPYAKFYGGRIELPPGENTIRLDPMVAGCEIIPRWWEI